MVEPNATLPLIKPVSQGINYLWGFVSFLVGGIFGIVVITLIVRVYFFRKLLKIFRDIKAQLSRLENKMDRLSGKK